MISFVVSGKSCTFEISLRKIRQQVVVPFLLIHRRVLFKISRVDISEIGSVIDFGLDWGVDDIFDNVILRIE